MLPAGTWPLTLRCCLHRVRLSGGRPGSSDRKPRRFRSRWRPDQSSLGLRLRRRRVARPSDERGRVIWTSPSCRLCLLNCGARIGAARAQFNTKASRLPTAPPKKCAARSLRWRLNLACRGLSSASLGPLKVSDALHVCNATGNCPALDSCLSQRSSAVAAMRATRPAQQRKANTSRTALRSSGGSRSARPQISCLLSLY
jgi:hypothetical protein